MGQAVAVKKLLSQNLTPRSIQEFESECSVMWKLDHPNVVKFFGAVVTKTCRALVSFLVNMNVVARFQD
jgi:hypothetical protein